MENRILHFMKACFFSFSLLLLISVQHIDSIGLMATTPSEWMVGTEEKVCLVSQVGTPAVKVHIEVIKSTDVKILAKNFDLESGQSECVSLFVPSNLDVETVTLIVKASSDDKSYTLNKNVTVRIERGGLMMFIQTDKPTYKPADTVKIRILTLTGPDLKPLSDKVSLAFIEDPSKTRIMQWTDVNSVNGLSSLELALSSEPTLGMWTIKARVKDQEHIAQFEVKEYVLPKFEVQIIVEKKIFTGLIKMQWKVCARYTYGEPVQGYAETKVCSALHSWHKSDTRPCVNIKKALSKDGCAPFDAEVNKLKRESHKMTGTLSLFAAIKERGTGIVLNSTVSSEWDNNILSIDISKSPSVYKPGMSYNGHGSVTYLNGSTAPGMNVTVDIAGRPPSLNVTTDMNGLFRFSTTAQFTNPMNKSFNLQVSVPASRNSLHQPLNVTVDKYASGSKDVQPWFSPSHTYLQIQPISTNDLICGSPVTVHIAYVSQDDSPSSVDFHYQVTSRMNLIVSDIITTRKGASAKMFNFTFSFVITPAMSNTLKLLVFHIRPDGEMIADSLITSFEQCFENKVSIEFNSPRVQPGHPATLSLSAEPESLCSVAVVDKSIELMGAKYITKQSIVDMLKSRYESSVSHYGYGSSFPGCKERNESDADVDHDQTENEPAPPGESPWKRTKRSRYMWNPHRSEFIDSQQPFKDIGLIVVTDLTIETRPCDRIYMRAYSLNSLDHRRARTNDADELNGEMAIPMTSSSHSNGASKPQTLHRTYFPETWLWDLQSLGSTGKREVPVTLPHTITEWVGSGFCVSQQSGLGISEPFRITAFQPFFVSFTLPYSMIRGEKVAIPVSVFNYLTECLQVKLVVDKSPGFSLVNDTYEVLLRVCGGDTEVPSFFLIPQQIGIVNFTVRASSEPADAPNGNSSMYGREKTNAEDIVTRQLLVKAEGKEEELTKSAFLCGAASGDWSFSLPADIVANSTRAHISVIGDVMGPALSGIDSLLTMPMGCGEQNMVLFAPNIFILQYLNKTKRLTPTVHAKALSFMQTGYQRELTYRHTDGSYSAFGNSDPEGSIWLTAFVVKSFAQAKPYMFIDEKDLNMSIDWMISVQLENGCFPQIGRVLHKEMKGGAGDSLTSLTAYILIALLETGMNRRSPVITNTLKCLEAQSIDDAYTLSLVAYAYSLLGQNTAGVTGSTKAAFMQKLNDKAVTSDGMKHWSSGPHMITLDEDELHHSSPANVEMSAYVLLALLQSNDLSMVPQATPIVRWLSAQRNAYGGFSSTQDTVLALQALAQYAGLVHRDDINLKVVISSGSIDHLFKIVSDSSLLLQKREGLAELKKVKYSMEGIGCALLQASMKYNRVSLLNDQPQAFIITSVSPALDKNKNCNERTIQICARYDGVDSVSNMAVIAVGMVSGWIPDKSSIQKLKNQARLGLKRFDIEKDAVQFYFDELDKKDRCFSFGVVQSLQVADTKPALIHVYDYYAPSSSAFTQHEIVSTCPFREVLMARAMQMNAAKPGPGKVQPKPARNSTHPKVVPKPKCPVCNQTNLVSLCKASFVYKVQVGNNGSLKMLEIIRFNSSAKQPRLEASHRYNILPKCSCTILQSGSTVFIGSPSRFLKPGREWVIVLKNWSSIAAASPGARCPEKAPAPTERAPKKNKKTPT